jgi:hypothetical protein
MALSKNIIPQLLALKRVDLIVETLKYVKIYGEM